MFLTEIVYFHGIFAQLSVLRFNLGQFNQTISNDLKFVIKLIRYIRAVELDTILT